MSDPSSEKDPSRQADGDESGRISAYAMELDKISQPGDNLVLKVDCQAEELPSQLIETHEISLEMRLPWAIFRSPQLRLMSL